MESGDAFEKSQGALVVCGRDHLAGVGRKDLMWEGCIEEGFDFGSERQTALLELSRGESTQDGENVWREGGWAEGCSELRRWDEDF